MRFNKFEHVVAIDEDELISSVFNRKGRAKIKFDNEGKPKIKVDSKTMKKTPKSKGKMKLDEDIDNELLSALLNPDVSPEELELCYGPGRGRKKL